MTDLVLRSDDGGLATLTLNRPEKLNALSVALFQELRAHVDALGSESDTTGCVVLRGAGRAFSAGNDLEGILAGVTPPYPGYQAETIAHLAALPQPVIVAVHGHCYTGALELALAADLIAASPSARFADTHSRLALTPIWGMSQRLPRRIGVSRAKEMMFTGRVYSGEEALTLGLANFCFPDDAFDEEVDKLARGILENSWFSLQAIKGLVDGGEELPLAEALRYEVDNNPGAGPDLAERVARLGER